LKFANTCQISNKQVGISLSSQIKECISKLSDRKESKRFARIVDTPLCPPSPTIVSDILLQEKQTHFPSNLSLTKDVEWQSLESDPSGHHIVDSLFGELSGIQYVQERLKPNEIFIGPVLKLEYTFAGYREFAVMK
jgi:hypothetical protein